MLYSQNSQYRKSLLQLIIESFINNFSKLFVLFVITATFNLQACSLDKLAEIVTADVDAGAEEVTGLSLIPWRSLQGARTEGELPGHIDGGYLQLAQPVAITARWPYLYIADEGHQAILRYDLTLDKFSVFYKLNIAHDMRMQVMLDNSLYVSDPINNQVLQLSHEGRLLRTFSDFNLRNPVAIAEDNRRGDVLIADGFFNKVLVFNRLGRLINIIQPKDESGQRLIGLQDLFVGPEGIYLLDKVSHSVVIMDRDGNFRDAYGADVLKQPVAISVDVRNRVIVADAFDSKLKLFVHGQIQAQEKTSDVVSLGLVTDMYIHENWLYVVDKATARIEIFRIAPVALPEKEKDQPTMKGGA